jgi:hypothetical protein
MGEGPPEGDLVERAMASWVLKAAMQGMASLLPGAEQVNRLFQRYVSGTLALDETLLLTKFGRCRRHLENYAAHAVARVPVSVLEIGTGWLPVVPVGFALCGAEPVWSVDIVSHLEREQVLEVLRAYVDCRGGLEGIVPERLARLEAALASPAASAEELLAQVGVTSVVADVRSLDVGRDIDLVVSNNTLEHIPYEVLYEIFTRFADLVAEGGVMSHWIDMSDHYMNFDPSIGPYNFLKFPDFVWRLFNNKHQYQNRLRLPDFRYLHKATGFTIVDEQNTQGRLEDLQRVTLAREFRRYRPDDLLVYETWMVSRLKG